MATFNGNLFANRIDRSADTQNNLINGLGGNDTLLGGSGDDTLDGGTGYDLMIGGRGNDTYIVNATSDKVTEAADGGIDTVLSSISLDLSKVSAFVEHLTLTGTSGLSGTGNGLDNTLTGNAGANTLSGLDGNDLLKGLAGKDRLLGGNGNDTLDGGTGNDTLTGGTGDDTYIVDSTGDLIVEGANAGTDEIVTQLSWTLSGASDQVEHLTLTGTAAVNATGNAVGNRLTGNSSANRLDGQAGDDVVRSGAGNDTLMASAGNDTLAGDDGADTYVFSQGDGQDVVEADGLDTIVLGAGITRDSLTIGKLGEVQPDAVALGIGTTDRITLTSAGRWDGLTLRFADGGTLSGVQIMDEARRPRALLLDGTSGSDLLQGGRGNDTLNGMAGIDTLEGAAGDDVLLGGDNSDSLDGGTGADTLIGGRGSDIYHVDDVGDVVIEEPITTAERPGPWAPFFESTDIVISSVSLNGTPAHVELIQLEGNRGDLTLTGTDDRQGLFGNEAHNRLEGLGGDDDLRGDLGDDTLVGGRGNDRLDGGSGADLLVFAQGDGQDTLASLDDADRIAVDRVFQPEALTATLSTDAGGRSSLVLNFSDGDQLALLDPGTWNGLHLHFRDGYTLTGAALVALSERDSARLLPGTDASETLTGGSGNDTLNGLAALGEDTLIGGAGDDVYVVNSPGDVLIENPGGGIDTVQTRTTLDLSVRGAAIERAVVADGYRVETRNEIWYPSYDGYGYSAPSGISYTVTTYYYDQIDLTGNALDNELIGGDARPRGSSPSGYNAPYVNRTEYRGSTGNRLDGGAGNDTLWGLAGNDTLSGGEGDDLLDGGADNDILAGGSGQNTLRGGLGSDTYYVTNATDVIVEIDPADPSLASLPWPGDYPSRDVVVTSVSLDRLAAHIEEVRLATGASPLEVNGNDQAQQMVGNEGDNTLRGLEGDDTLIGGLGNDLLLGGDGNDQLFDESGKDTLDGGNGSDFYTVGNFYAPDNQVVVIVDTGTDLATDTVLSYVSFDLRTNSQGIERLLLSGSKATQGIGNDADNEIIGNSSVGNLLDGGLGNDILRGGSGRDTLVGSDAGGDSLYGGAGDDIYQVSGDEDFVYDSGFANASYDIVLSAGNLSQLGEGIEEARLLGATAHKLTGNALNNLLYGNEQDNTVEGLDGRDTLFGLDGNDLLRGGAGSDVLDGGAGADELDGGTGNDSDIFCVDDVGDVILDGGAAIDRSNPWNLQGGDQLHSTISLATIPDVIELVQLMGTAHLNVTGTDLAQIIRGNTGHNLLMGLGGGDVLVGDGGMDTLMGGAGNDTIAATDDSQGDSADTIVFNAGDGQDHVALDTNDQILLGEGLSLEGTDIQVGDDAASARIVFATGDSLHIDNAAQFGTGTLVFTDGQRLTSSDVLSRLADQVPGVQLVAGAPTYWGEDVYLVGTLGNDTLDSGTSDGMPYLAGGSGDDTYIVRQPCSIEDFAGVDTVILKAWPATPRIGSFGAFNLAAGIENAQIEVTELAVVGNALDNILDRSRSGLTNDPRVWLRALDGGAGNDTLIGHAGHDRLTGGSGNDWLMGGEGNDVYLMGADFGHDVITDTASQADSQDTLIFTAQTVDQLWFQHVGDDLVVSVVGSADAVTVTGWFSSPASRLESVQVADAATGATRTLTATGVDALVAAMAGFAPQSLSGADVPAELVSAVQSAWA